jgi:hypothetical protein
MKKIGNKFLYGIIAILLIIILILFGIIFNDKNQKVIEKQEVTATSQLTETTSDNGYITTAEHLRELSELKKDTDTTTATASTILSGRTAYVNGVKTTGTMANQSGQTVTATTITGDTTNAYVSIPTNGYYDTTSKISVPIETITNNVTINSNITKLSPQTSSSNSITWDLSGYDGYQNFTIDNFLFIPTSVAVYLWYNGSYSYTLTQSGTRGAVASVTKSYDSSTGKLVMSKGYCSKDFSIYFGAYAWFEADAYLVK